MISAGEVRTLKFTFKDITDASIYDSAHVMLIMGPYNIFNNIVIDEIKDRCTYKETISASGWLFDEFDDIEDNISDGATETGDNITITNSVNLDTFMTVNNVPSLYGIWFCSVDYSTMTKKQKDWLNKYIKSPSQYGRLVVYISDFRDYKFFLKNKIVLNSSIIHAIQLGFPSRQALEIIVRALFEDRGVYIEQKAIELFIMRMSASYDQYEEIIDKIILESVPKDLEGQDKTWKYTVTYDDTLAAMKGIENFVLDDFLNKLLVPLASDRTTGRNRIYRMLGALLKEMGAKELVTKLKYKINDYIEFRLAINSGEIPILVRFSVPEAKERLGEDSKITRFSDYTFRRMAQIASQTSLRDWVYMKMILSKPSKMSGNAEYERALYSLISRSVLTESRLNNDIGLDYSLNIDLKELDKIPYNLDKISNTN